MLNEALIPSDYTVASLISSLADICSMFETTYNGYKWVAFDVC